MQLYNCVINAAIMCTHIHVLDMFQWILVPFGLSIMRNALQRNLTRSSSATAEELDSIEVELKEIISIEVRT